MNKNPLFLSKSQFIRGLQCHKSLYLYKFHKKLRDEVSEAQEAIFQAGTDVGILAQQLFPNGIEIPFEGHSFSEQCKKTDNAINDGIPSIYEATFIHDSLFARVDILSRDGEGWAINEVKSSTEVKAVHVNDVAFQYFILNSLGLPVSRATLVHINNQYVRHGEIDVSELFTINDITADILPLQDEIRIQIQDAREMLKGDIPDIDIGEHCYSPYECDFMGHCWKHIPEQSVFSLRGRGIKKFELYQDGIIKLEDIPVERLPEHAQIQVEAALEKKDFIDKEAIKEFLDTLWYPMAFLDFETFMSSVPLFDNTRPYEQVPFQYSLHVLDAPDAELKHYEFLAEPDVDPREGLINKLIPEIPDDACVVAYNMSFEKRVLNALKPYFPQHEKQIDSINDNMRDLMIPFRNKAYYSWQMEGSYSIKAVLPVLVPELSYKELEIADGGMAMNAYHDLGMLHVEDKEKLCKALLEYCKLDTLAMYRIFIKLTECYNISDQ